MARLKDKLNAWRQSRRAAEDGSGPSPVPAPDVSGVAAFADKNPLSTALFVHRQTTYLRVFVAVSVLFAVVILMQAAAISNLLPLKKTEFALVHTFGPEEQLYRVEPLSQDIDGLMLFLEKRVGRWVQLVFALDRPTQEVRWQEAVHMTDSALWNRMQKTFVDRKAIAKVLSDGLTREVEIKGASQVAEQEDGNRLFVVDFVQRDFSNARQIKEQVLRGYVVVTLRPKEVIQADRYLNPLGVTVVDFKLQEGRPHGN